MELARDTTAVYVQVALDDMTAALKRFDDSNVNDRPFGDGTNSAAVLITHACAAARFWLEHIGLGRPTDRNRDAEFTTLATVEELASLIAHTAAHLATSLTAFETGPTAIDHELRVFAPGADRSDGSMVLHTLQELFQHLGHLESTADAIEFALNSR